MKTPLNENASAGTDALSESSKQAVRNYTLPTESVKSKVVELSEFGRPIYPVLASGLNGEASGEAAKVNGSTSTYTSEEGAEEPKTIWPTLRYVKNDLATITQEILPWEFVPNVPAFESKAEFNKWRNQDSTEHCEFLSSEGINPDLRPNKKTNPVRRLRALIADYDSKINDTMEDAVLRNAPADLRPNWISTTYSNGRRLVFLFDKPVPFDDIIAKRFYEVAGKELKVSMLLPGIDKNWSNPYHLFDVGTNWRMLSNKPIESKFIHHWLFEAAQKTDWSKVGDLKIPLDQVAEEVERLYPGRWEGEFEEGRRGVVFFNPDSVNPSASVVAENGMICFGEPKAFYSWAELFPALARKYQADKIGSAVEGVWFDGKSYFRKINDAWQSVAKDDFALWLRTDRKLEPVREKKTTHSEVDDALNFVQNNRRVAGVAPYVFDRRDVIEINGARFLNNARVKPIQPADEPQEWGKNFPWLARFLEAKLDDTEREILLAWWRRFYSSALAGNLDKGHAMFCVGDVRTGKTLTSNKIIGASVGGFSDASDYVSKGSEFNKELLEVGLWTIDDAVVASDPTKLRKFAETVKRLVANPSFNYRAMFRDAQRTTWNGRLIVTLNETGNALQMIPELDSSIEEKIIILRFRNNEEAPFTFKSSWEIERTIETELPFLLRWLIDSETPEPIRGDSRFGVRPYINEVVRSRALQAGDTGTLLELIDVWLKHAEPAGDCWWGTASQFYALVAQDEVVRPLVQKYTPKSIGKHFTNAASKRDSGITVVEAREGYSKRYQIELRGRGQEPRRTHRVSFETA